MTSRLSRAWAIGLALVAVTVVAFEGIRHLDFVAYDDPKYVTDNIHVLGGLTWTNIRWAFTTVYGPYWHPLTLISHMADIELFGLWAGGHHLVNGFLHLVNTVLLFLLLRRLTGSSARSGIVAALFAVHPLHVESVAWVTERLDVLSTCFFLLTIWAYVAYVSRPSLGRYLGVVAVYVCGLMSKPTLITLPVVLLLLDVWPLGRIQWAAGSPPPPVSDFLTVVMRRVREKLPLIVLALAGAVGTLIYESRHGSVTGIDLLPVGERIANAFVWYITYLGRMFWPAHLSAFYPYPREMPAWWVIAGAIAIVATVSAFAWRLRARAPYFFVGWAWYLVTLLPLVGLVQAADQATADRFTYIPLIGIFIALTWGISALVGRWPRGCVVAEAAAAVVVVVLVPVTRAQVRVWQNTTTLWTNAIAATRDNHRAHAGLGQALLEAKRPDAALVEIAEAIRIYPDVPTYHNDLGLAMNELHRTDEAMASYREALRLDPNFAQAQTNLGYVLASAGQFDEAVARHRKALSLNPDLAEAHVNLASALMRERKLVEAIPHVEQALRLNPRLAQAHAVYGAIMQLQNRDSEAIVEYQAALAIDPDLSQVHSNLGGALAKRSDFAGAAREFREALRLDPLLGDAHNGLGVVLMSQGQVDEAIAHYREAVRLKPDSISTHSNLGIALAQRGDVAGAVHEFNEVLRIDPGNAQAKAALEYLKKPKGSK
jgi:protein O-mannosyl-transferase